MTKKIKLPEFHLLRVFRIGLPMKGIISDSVRDFQTGFNSPPDRTAVSVFHTQICSEFLEEPNMFRIFAQSIPALALSYHLPIFVSRTNDSLPFSLPFSRFSLQRPAVVHIGTPVPDRFRSTKGGARCAPPFFGYSVSSAGRSTTELISSRSCTT